jgi:hypothetical protein
MSIMSNDYNNLYKVEPLDSTNWPTWKRKNKAILRKRKLTGYIDGTILQPVPAKPNEPDETEQGLIATWREKDLEAQDQIFLTLGVEETVHVEGAENAKGMWDALLRVHEVGGKGVLINDLRELFRITADEDTNLEEHLTNVRKLQSQLRRQHADIPDWIYTTLMITSLPNSWDSFATGYIGRSAGTAFDVNSSQMESIIRSEWK